MKLIKFIIFFVGICSFQQLFSQLRSVHYSIETGLQSDVIKSIALDKYGFLWLGCDEGIMRFDGKNSILYNNVLQSNYVKDFILLKDSTFLVANDLGLCRVDNLIDTIAVTQIIGGQIEINNPKDSLLIYPKKLYQSNDNTLWISEYVSLTSYKNGKIKKYYFSNENRTSDFSRSFCYAENALKQLWVSSFTGNLFYFDSKNDCFQQIENEVDIHQINDILFTDNETLLIGAANGLFEMKIEKNKKLRSCRLLESISAISCLQIFDNQLYIGTWTNGLYSKEIKENSPLKKVEAFPAGAINDLFIDKKNKKLWIASNDGLFLLQNSFFNEKKYSIPANLAGMDEYIQSITEAVDGTIYVSTGVAIIKFAKAGNSYTSEYLFDWHNGFIARIAADINGLWLADSFGEIFFYSFETQNIEHKKTNNLGRYINFLFLDSDRNLWACQDELIGLLQISVKSEIKYYTENEGLKSSISVIRQDKNKTLYCAGNNPDAYLYRKHSGEKHFKNISIALPEKWKKAFAVFDIGIENENNIYLATNLGVLFYNEKTISLINFGAEHCNETIRSLALAPDSSLWFSNSFGIVHYKNGETLLFNKSSGLPAATISARNLFISKKDEFWVGTTKGLAYAQNIKVNTIETPEPIILNFSANETQYINEKKPKLAHHSFIETEFVSLCYPGENIIYKTRLLGLSNQWSHATSINKLTFPLLSVGNYTFQIIALQQGGDYNWSTPFSYSFSIKPPWYFNLWAVLGFVCLLIIFIVLIIRIVIWKMKREKRLLELIIGERTAHINQQKEELSSQAESLKIALEELSKVNLHLEEINIEKNKMMSVVAHDLKTPLANVYSLLELMERLGELNDSQKEISTDIFKVLSEGIHFIQNLLDINAIESGKQKRNDETIELKPFVEEIIKAHKIKAEKKNNSIEFHCNQKEVNIFSDKMYLSRILDNLLSNAVKFSPENSTIVVKLLKTNNLLTISIKDSGQGFSDDDKKLLFKRFQKLSARPTAGESSSGLGLSIVKSLADQLNIEIELISELNKGAEFVLNFN